MDNLGIATKTILHLSNTKIMSKRDLKKYLNDLSKVQLEAQIISLYEKFIPVKTYYNFVFKPDENNLVAQAKVKIAHEYFPIKTKKAKMRRSVAQKHIKHFISLGVDPFLLADVMLYTLEIAQTLSAEKEIKSDLFYKSMLTSYQQVFKFLLENGIINDFKGRLLAINEQTAHQNWPNKYAFTTLVKSFEF